MIPARGLLVVTPGVRMKIDLDWLIVTIIVWIVLGLGILYVVIHFIRKIW